MFHSDLIRGLVITTALLLAVGCSPRKADREENGKLKVVATTNLVGDLAAIIGGEAVEVTSLMGPGVDPHLYKASEGDVRRMAGAEAIFYGGLHLEGKMTDIFEQMKSRDIPTFPVTAGNPDSIYIESPNFGGNYDPHIWFDVSLWKGAASYVAGSLSELVPERGSTFQSNLVSYLTELDSLDAWVRSRTKEVPQSARVVITSHDAFGYFGRAYGYEVRGLQGISTAAEAGAGDVQDLAAFVASNRIPAMFVESSVPARGIEAVREAVRSRGFDVRIGGNLFSDALGAPDTPEGTYVGMFRYNVNTIVDALKGGSPS